MRRRVTVAVCVLLAAVLVGGVVALVVHESPADAPATDTRATDPASPAATPTTTTPAPLPPGPLSGVLPELEAFVERERGLRFERPVKVTLLEGPAFNDRAVQIDDEGRKDVQDAEAVLQAMGLLDADVDLEAEVGRFIEGATLGFYDAEAGELVVRGAAVTPLLRVTLVHELTHALEDQHFGLHRKDLGDEAAVGFQSLAEGSALRIEDRYRDTLSAAERRQATREEAQVGAELPANIPEVVEQAFGFPYTYGPGLVRRVLAAGGQVRLDAAYADPPASSEHVMDPGRYVRGDRPRPVAVPRADGRAFDDGEIGQLFLLLMLDAELPTGPAFLASVGWGGDRYVAWREGARTCVRMEFVMDTPKDTDELVSALADWAEERGPRAQASGTSLRTCSS